jgi:polar amino acid transport system substrate-binding protein
MRRGFSAPRLAILALAIAAMIRGPANAASLEEIKARGTLLIGAEIASPPYISRDNDEIVGYEPDILAEMAGRLGVKLKIVDSAWSGILPSLIAGKFDAVFAGMTVTKDRLAKVFFTTPYANDPVSIMVYTNSDIHAIQDMSGKRLGFAFGGALDQFINGYNATLVKEGRAPMELKTYDTPLDAIADLQNRRLDAALNKRTTLNRVIATRTKGQFRVVSDMKAMVDLSFLIAGAVPKDDPTLLAFMNATLRDMKESGKLAALQRKWFGEEMDVPVDMPANLP